MSDTTPSQQSKPRLPFSFVRFPSIDNLDSIRAIPSPEDQRNMRIQTFVTEKLDGCNLGICIPKHGEIKAYSRNGEDAEGLYQFAYDKRQLVAFLAYVQDHIAQLDEGAEGVYLYGEYFGDKIMHRIHYGENRFVFYDMMILKRDEKPKLLPPNEFYSTMVALAMKAQDDNEGDFFDFIINLGWIPTYFKGKEFQSKDDIRKRLPLPFDSYYSEDHAEGYVVTMVGDNNFWLRFKLKDPAFIEVSRKKKPVSERVELMDDEKQLHEEFVSYFTENRALGVLSKTTVRKLDQLIRLLIADAKEDFMKLHGDKIAVTPKAKQKLIFNAKTIPLNLMREVLNKEAENDSGNLRQ